MTSRSCVPNKHEVKLMNGRRIGDECRFCGKGICLQETASGNGCMKGAGHLGKHSNGHAKEK